MQQEIMKKMLLMAHQRRVRHCCQKKIFTNGAPEVGTALLSENKTYLWCTARWCAIAIPPPAKISAPIPGRSHLTSHIANPRPLPRRPTTPPPLRAPPPPRPRAPTTAAPPPHTGQQAAAAPNHPAADDRTRCRTNFLIQILDGLLLQLQFCILVLVSSEVND